MYIDGICVSIAALDISASFVMTCPTLNFHLGIVGTIFVGQVVTKYLCNNLPSYLICNVTTRLMLFIVFIVFSISNSDRT